MDRFAQARSKMDTIFREPGNFFREPGNFYKHIFHPELKELMVKLRETDDAVRSIATGEDLTKTDEFIKYEFDDSYSLQDVISNVKSNINRREFFQAISDLGKFDHKLKLISNYLSKFNSTLSTGPMVRLLNLENAKSKFDLEGLKDRMDSKEASIQEKYALIKQAGVFDFLHNTFTGRGRELKFLESVYPTQFKIFKEGLKSLFELAKSTLEKLKGHFALMSTARARRQAGEYHQAATACISDNQKYLVAFKSFYEKPEVKGMIDQYVEIAKKTEPKVTTELPLPKVDLSSATKKISPVIPNSKNTPADALDDAAKGKWNVPLPVVDNPNSPENLAKLYNAKNPSDSVVVTDPASAPDSAPALGLSGRINANPVSESIQDQIKRNRPGGPLRVRENHSKFYNTLKVLSNESPLFLASYISKYASSISESDPSTSKKLFNIVKSIQG